MVGCARGEVQSTNSRLPLISVVEAEILSLLGSDSLGDGAASTGHFSACHCSYDLDAFDITLADEGSTAPAENHEISHP